MGKKKKDIRSPDEGERERERETVHYNLAMRLPVMQQGRVTKRKAKTIILIIINEQRMHEPHRSQLFLLKKNLYNLL